VTGRVVDTGGDPIASARVCFGDTEFGGRYLISGVWLPHAAPQRTRTDGEGRFDLTSAAAGVHDLEVRAEGFGQHASQVEVIPGSSLPLEIVLQPHARVVGRVLAADGSPAVQARISAPTAAPVEPRAYSTYDGTFTLEELAAGEHTISVHHDLGLASETFFLAPGETVEWEPILTDAGVPRIHGRLLDAQGEPAPGWSITIRREVDGSTRSSVVGTDSAGRFAVQAERDQPYDLSVNRAEAFMTFPAILLRDVLASPVPLELRLPPDGQSPDAARIAATVLAPSGEVATDVTFTVFHLEEQLSAQYHPDPETGAVDVRNVPQGTVYVYLGSLRYPEIRFDPREVRAGEWVDLGEIRLAASGLALGAITAWPGFDGATLTALVYARKGTYAGSVEHATDSYRTSPLPPGDYELELSGDHVVTKRYPFTVEVERETVMDVTLTRAGLREAHFDLPAELPAEEARLWAELFDAAGRVVWTGRVRPLDESTLVARVSAPPGIYRVRAHSGPDLPWEAQGPFEIRDLAGEQPPLRFRVGRAAGK